jgi:hypothetical protein
MRIISLRSLFLFISLQLWILNLYGQDQYLIMTRERHIGTSPTTLAEVPLAIAVDIITEKLAAPAPVERKIREGSLVKVISSGETGKEKNKGRLDILSDSVISVGSGAIIINDIEKIFVKSVFSKVSGPVITCAGVAGTIFTTPWFLESLTLFNGGVLQILGGFILVPIAASAVIGCAVASIMGLVYFINGRVFNIADNRLNNREGWRIHVVSAYSVIPQGP